VWAAAGLQKPGSPVQWNPPSRAKYRFSPEPSWVRLKLPQAGHNRLSASSCVPNMMRGFLAVVTLAGLGYVLASGDSHVTVLTSENFEEKTGEADKACHEQFERAPCSIA
jgi:hypothetical protein